MMQKQSKGKVQVQESSDLVSWRSILTNHHHHHIRIIIVLAGIVPMDSFAAPPPAYEHALAAPLHPCRLHATSSLGPQLHTPACMSADQLVSSSSSPDSGLCFPQPGACIYKYKLSILPDTNSDNRAHLRRNTGLIPVLPDGTHSVGTFITYVFT